MFLHSYFKCKAIHFPYFRVTLFFSLMFKVYCFYCRKNNFLKRNKNCMTEEEEPELEQESGHACGPGDVP